MESPNARELVGICILSKRKVAHRHRNSSEAVITAIFPSIMHMPAASACPTHDHQGQGQVYVHDQADLNVLPRVHMHGSCIHLQILAIV